MKKRFFDYFNNVSIIALFARFDGAVKADDDFDALRFEKFENCLKTSGKNAARRSFFWDEQTPSDVDKTAKRAKRPERPTYSATGRVAFSRSAKKFG